MITGFLIRTVLLRTWETFFLEAARKRQNQPLADNYLAITGDGVERARPSLFYCLMRSRGENWSEILWLVTNVQDDLPASMTRVRLCLGLGCISRRKSFGNDDLIFF